MREEPSGAFVITSAMVGRMDLGSGTALIDDGAVTLVLGGSRGEDKRWRLRIDMVIGARCEDTNVTLSMRDGSRLALDAPEGSILHARLLAACRTLPELTRALRAMGSRRSGAQDREGGTAEESAFFSPLLSARKRASLANDPLEVIAAFDAEKLRASIHAVLERCAEARAGDRAPLRRAIEAELGDAAEPLFAVLEELSAASARAASAVDDLERWRHWARVLRTTFEAADRVWVVLNRVLMHPVVPLTPPRAPARGKKAIGLILAACALGALAPHSLLAQLRTLQVVGVPVDSLIRRGFDVVDRRGNDALIVANPSDEATLRARGWSTIEIRPTVGASRSITAPTVVYRSFDDPARGVRVFLDSLAKANPRVHLDTIGRSYEGRPMLAVKIGPADDSPARANVLITATYHAREWAATETALRLIRYLATGIDARVDSLTKQRDIWILPVSNPDGYQYTFTTERLWRKNRRPVGISSGGVPEFGVDLNRNHTAFWGFDESGSSSNPGSEVYRGSSPASEPEVAAIEAFHRAHPPVAAISYHTYAGLMLFPPGHTSGALPADLGIFRTLGGTDEHPGALDRLPGSVRSAYHTAPGWNLYPTNGEYTDYAYGTFGTIAFTPELTSGYENGGYYGFQFPDDEARLDIVFRDQLPFALDLIESAADPVAYVSPTTGLATESVVVESVSPIIRLRVPVAADVTVTTSAPVPMKASSEGTGKYFRGLVSDTIPRPARVEVSTPSRHSTFTVLAAGGAEPEDGAWQVTGFVSSPAMESGKAAWFGTVGSIRSPLMPVPAAVDTVSVTYWTKYNGDGSGAKPHGEVRLSIDKGVTWTRVGSVAGAAPVYYPERVLIGGVASKTIQIQFISSDNPGLAWWIDEVAVLAHSVSPLVVATTTALRPNANPVRGNAVIFNWPFATQTGELRAYDFSGRLVWRTPVAGSTTSVTWNLGAPAMPNGVYLVVAQTGQERKTFKLFVARNQE